MKNSDFFLTALHVKVKQQLDNLECLAIMAIDSLCADHGYLLILNKPAGGREHCQVTAVTTGYAQVDGQMVMLQSLNIYTLLEILIQLSRKEYTCSRLPLPAF